MTDEQIQKLIKEIRYQEAKILFMESQERACLEGGMRYIIDRDGCEIYYNHTAWVPCFMQVKAFHF